MIPLQDFQNDCDYHAWLIRRRNTTWISYFLIFLYGIEAQSVMVTMIYYISDNFKMTTIESSFYFGIIEAIMSIGQVLGGLIIGRYTDRTRNLRLVILVNIILIMSGNLMYSLPFHLALLAAGRLLCGVNESLQTAFSGKYTL